MATAGADAVEIKATVAARQVDGALVRFNLHADNDEERFIYFFDTPELLMLEAGIIARARRVVGEEHDSTLKFRPVDPGKVDANWRKYRDFKIEADASEAKLVTSASFSMPVERGLIKRVAAGQRPVAALFTTEQRQFLRSMTEQAIDYERVVVLGPLRAQRWRFDEPSCPYPITAELWQREDGERLMEVSIKAPAPQAAFAYAGFMALLAELGAERDTNEKAKTRWALDYYATKLAAQMRAAAKPAVQLGGAKPAPRKAAALAIGRRR